MATRINFDKPSYAVSRFSVVSALGRSIRLNLKALFDATHRKSNPNWSGIINILNQFVDVILPGAGPSKDPTAQINLAKSTISGLGSTWPEANSEVEQAL